MGKINIFKVFLNDGKETKIISVHLSGILAYGAASAYYKKATQKMGFGMKCRDITYDDKEMVVINTVSGEKVKFYVETEEFDGGLMEARDYVHKFSSPSLDVFEYFDLFK